MTRILTILLIVLHLMNTIGSYGILAKLSADHEKSVSEQLDEDKYAGSNTITLKVPFSLPYHTNTGNYERAIGKIQYEGQTYHMVKHKFYNDTLFIVCLKDTKLTEIDKTLTRLAESMASNREAKDSNTSTVSIQIRDFEVSLPIQFSRPSIQLLSLELPAYFFASIIHSVSPLYLPPKA